MSYSIDDNDFRPRPPLAGGHQIAQSLVQGPGWNPFDDPYTEDNPNGGGGGSSGSYGMGGEYRGRIGADTSNLPPSQRGLYENSAPSRESIQGAYDANLKNGMTHEEIMTLFNNQADNDKKFWADGFAKDADFSNNLQRQSQAMLGTNQAAKQLLYDRGTKKNRYGQTVNDQLRAGAGVYDKPRQGAMPGGRSSAPMAKVVRSVSPGGGNSRRSYTAPKVKKSTQRIGGRYGL